MLQYGGKTSAPSSHCVHDLLLEVDVYHKHRASAAAPLNAAWPNGTHSIIYMLLLIRHSLGARTTRSISVHKVRYALCAHTHTCIAPPPIHSSGRLFFYPSRYVFFPKKICIWIEPQVGCAWSP